ncbi:MAG: aminotransferase class IV [Deltaproteobacteria bacterium]|nr:aminotransferase class IV [Deltaproteobacteria bacterium]
MRKKSLVLINGRWIPEGHACVPISDSAYLYGHGVFETMKVVKGHALFIPEHFERLRGNAYKLNLKLPLNLSLFEQSIRRLIQKNKCDEAVLRFTLSQTPEGKPFWVMATKVFVPYPRSCYTRGGRLILIRSVRADSLEKAGVKTTSYLTKILGRQEAQQRGAVEGIFLNEEGNVTEGGSSNLFIVKKGILLTPPLSEGLLPGTRRKAVITLARKLKIPFKEKILRPKDLLRADEIFITSSLKDILPIASLDDKKIGDGGVGEVTKRLVASYEAGYKFLA